MCGRYASSRSAEDLATEFDIPDDDLPRLEPDYNVAPTKQVYAVVDRSPADAPEGGDDSAERRLRTVSWGLVPFWAKDTRIGNRMINARVETVAQKPAFRRALQKRRAILPADGYYEWYLTGQLTAKGKPRKQPFYIRPRDGEVLAMAGLYEIWRDPEKSDDDPARFWWSATVLTTEAVDHLGRIHDRMPLMLAPADYAAWLDPARPGADLLDLLTPASPDLLEAYPVSALVSNVRNNGPDLTVPIGSGEAGSSEGDGS